MPFCFCRTYFFVAVVFRQDLPVAGHWLFDPYHHVFILAVFQFNAIGAFKDIVVFSEAGKFLKVCLFAFCRDVKGVAQLEPDTFIFRGMIYTVFTDKLRAAIAVLLVDPNDAFWQGQAEVLRFSVFKGEVYGDLDLGAQVAGSVPVIIILSLEKILLGACNIIRLQQGDLFCLVFQDAGCPVQCIKVVIKEGFLSHSRGFSRIGNINGLFADSFFKNRLHLVHITGNKLQPRIFI